MAERDGTERSRDGVESRNPLKEKKMEENEKVKNDRDRCNERSTDGVESRNPLKEKKKEENEKVKR